MKRRDFLASSAAAAVGAGIASDAQAQGHAESESGESTRRARQAGRKILIAGGGFGTAFIRYMAELTGRDRPRLCYLPTASADRESGIIRWYENCAPLDVVPTVQPSFISSYRQDRSWEEVFLSVDGIVVSGGNTLNQQAIWRVQGIDQVLREAWDRGIVLGGASAGSLCWFEEGTTDSRPKEVTRIECLGFLEGSHSPHYDAEAVRRPTYHRLIRSGELKPGYACDNDAGIYFEDNVVARVVKTRADAKVYHVALEGGQVVETELPGEMIQ
ncbi:MAG: peptidase E [Gemmatimonadota bacterium]|nr:peptidase E [Gemmatimonadota bacterium]